MNFFIRCDVHHKIGSGHASRCLNLSKILIQKRHKVYFVSKYIDKNFQKILLKNKIKLINLKKNKDQIKDAKNTLLKIKKIYKKNDWIIVDNYNLGYLWEKEINTFAKNLFVIDDFQNKKHDCRLLLDQNILDNKNKYNIVSKKTKILAGPKYSLLDENFFKLKKNIKAIKKLRNLIIFFGSSDEYNLTQKFVDILLKLNKKIKINLVIGVTNKSKNKILKKYNKNYQVNMFYNLDNLAKLMSNSDVFIGSGGVTTWERCCLKLPSLVVSTSENQDKHSRYLSKKKIIKYLGPHNRLKKINIKKELIKFIKIKNIKKLSVNSGKITDGLGCIKVYKEILKINEKN